MADPPEKLLHHQWLQKFALVTKTNMLIPLALTRNKLERDATKRRPLRKIIVHLEDIVCDRFYWSHFAKVQESLLSHLIH